MTLATSASDYIGIFKPRIAVLLDLVAVSALLVAAKSIPPLFTVAALVVTGSIASAGASALNNYFDRDLDSRMKRTRFRPLPSGRIQPANKVLVGGMVLSVASVLAAYLVLNLPTAFFIGLGVLFYVGVYTLWLKRRSTWNIVLGGFAGSCAALAGWSSITGWAQLTPWLMALIVFLWTPTHFWSLALRAKDDYANAGVPMLPVVVGEKKAIGYLIINTLALIAVSLAGFFLGAFGKLFFVAALVLGASLFYRNIRLYENTAVEAWRSFKFSNLYLAALFAAMVLDAFYTI